MKYIRTKDGRIGFVSSVREYNANKPLVFYAKVNGKIFPNLELGDVQFADTIEELCDEFALISGLEKRIIKPKELDRDCEGWTKEIGIPEGMIKVYGGIWTDKGLIFVAKMNKKGELELL